MGRATLAELVSLLLQLTLSPIVATGQDAGATVSYSALDFKTCASGAEFKLTDKSGVGQIVDKETGRCLTVKKCSAPWPSTACTNACVHGNGDVVVLEDCDLEDTWRVTALTNLPGYLAPHEAACHALHYADDIRCCAAKEVPLSGKRNRYQEQQALSTSQAKQVTKRLV